MILRGVNLSSRHKLPPYFDFHTAADVARIRDDWGMNAIRLLVSWSAVEPAENQVDAAYLDALAERVAWAEAAGLLVVVDMHQDLYGEGFSGGDGAPRWSCDEARYAAFVPRTPWFLGYTDPGVAACFDGLYTDARLRGRFVAAWAAVARRLAASPAVVGFDPLNEPSWGSANLYQFEAERLAPFYREIIAAVHDAAPRWIPFLEPSNARNLGIATGLPRFDTGWVYAPHAYDATAESGGGFDDARREAYVANVALLADEARARGAALVLGEYGGVAAQPGIAAYMDAAYDGAAAAGAGSFYWHYGRDEGYGLLHADGSEKTELALALVRPYPERIPGELESWTLDGDRLTVRYRPDPGVSAPLVVALPPGWRDATLRTTTSSGVVTVDVER